LLDASVDFILAHRPYLRGAPPGLPFSFDVDWAVGTSCRCVTLQTLIRLKRAAGRPKDLEAIAELEALRAEREAARSTNSDE